MEPRLAEKPSLTLERRYPVAPEKVWRAWTDPQAVNTTPERISVVTITFDAVGDGTELRFRHEQFFDDKARDSHRRGWTALLDKLDAFLGPRAAGAQA
jgi:uncharacterized protein YndB with AHSA1/START domain